MAPENLAAISGEVFGGAITPNHVTATKPGSPIREKGPIADDVSYLANSDDRPLYAVRLFALEFDLLGRMLCARRRVGFGSAVANDAYRGSGDLIHTHQSVESLS